jgi:DNA-binding transcriptional regulator YhcF (GntR family)
MHREASSDPLYQQVKDVLRSEIKAGRLKAGCSIPHERTLAESLKVSCKTTRRAIVELTNEGLFRRIRGRGTYVRESMEMQPIRRDCVLIACPFSPFVNPFYGQIFEGIHQGVPEKTRRVRPRRFDGYVS